jgi:hypothetical protein
MATVLFLCLGGLSLWCGYRAWAIYTVPTSVEAMRRSLTEINQPELKLAIALHPDYCTIDGEAGRGWLVECLGVPLHYYSDITICDGRGENCASAPPSWTDCTSFWWNVDMWGRPSPTYTTKGKYSSMGDDCHYKGTFADDRSEMSRRGLLPTRSTVHDYTGKWAPVR